MKEMFFKWTKRTSKSYGKGSYRAIIKEWDLSIDQMRYSDDVIIINCIDLETMKPKFNSISIDLDNKEWKFRIFVD